MNKPPTISLAEADPDFARELNERFDSIVQEINESNEASMPTQKPDGQRLRFKSPKDMTTDELKQKTADSHMQAIANDYKKQLMPFTRPADTDRKVDSGDGLSGSFKRPGRLRQMGRNLIHKSTEFVRRHKSKALMVGGTALASVVAVVGFSSHTNSDAGIPLRSVEPEVSTEANEMDHFAQGITDYLDKIVIDIPQIEAESPLATIDAPSKALITIQPGGSLWSTVKETLDVSGYDASNINVQKHVDSIQLPQNRDKSFVFSGETFEMTFLDNISE